MGSATTSIQGDPPTQTVTEEVGDGYDDQVVPVPLENDKWNDLSSGCPFASKVVALSVGMAAETVAVAATALLLK